jgi:cell division protein FtsI (penicillin-binding protein 3)
LCFIIPQFILYIIIIFRILSLVFHNHGILESTGKNKIIYKQPDILDRNGTIIATNLPTTSLYVDPTKIKEPENIAAQLCTIFSDLDYENLHRLLTSKKKFVWIKRHLMPKEVLIIKSVGVPGINFYDDIKRIYPYNNLFAHVLGYTDIDGKGIAGLEAYITQNKNNKTIKLSLDLRVQSIVRDELNKAIDKYHAHGGVGIIVNVKNGEIISMVSLPDFNPNRVNKATDVQKFNRATLGIYEMGSVLKLFTIAAALDAGVVTVDDVYNVSQPITIGKYKIYDLKKLSKQKITVKEIFTMSSNIGAAKVALDLGDMEYLKTMKLLSPLELEIPEKSMSIIPSKWNESTLITASYGYGIALTPIHIVQTAAALVNNGIFYNATLLLGKNSVAEQIISSTTSAVIKMLLRAAVIEGTGKKANVQSYSIGGKTGSAEKVVNGQYSKSVNIVSFIGVLTTLDPRYVIFIAIDEPQNMHSNTGGKIAAPVVKNIINRAVSVLNIIPAS